EPVEVRGESAQPVDDRVRRECSVVLGELHETVGVEANLELLVERPHESRVEKRAAAKLQLEIIAGATDGEGSQQDRRAVLDVVVSPLSDTDAEVNRVDAAHRGEFESLVGEHVRGG